MAPILYWSPTSPPSRAVLLCAEALGLQVDLKIVKLHEKEQFSPDYIKINPQHVVPTLIDSGGFIVCDSHAIMTYLVAKYGRSEKDKSLYPEELENRVIVDQRLFFHCGTLFPRGATITTAILNRGEKVSERDVNELREAYGFIESYFGKSNWIAGDYMTIADFSVSTSLTTWDILVPFEEDKFPKTALWLERMRNLPYFEKVNQFGVDMFRTKVQSCLATAS